MIKNLIRTAFRNFTKYKTYTFINIAGLTIGISASLFIFIFIHNETTYDQQFRPQNEVYRLLRHFDRETGSYDVGITSFPYAPALLNDFPGEIKESLRVMQTDGLVRYEEKSFLEEKIYLADSNFFDFFDIPLLKGNKEKALKAGSILISAEMSKKYFGDEDPINKILQLDNQFLFSVSGVFDEKKIHSHLHFDFLGSIDVLKNFSYISDWWSNSLSTYFMLEEGAQISSIESKFPAFIDKYFAANRTVGKGMSLKSESLNDIYFDNETTFDFVLHGNQKAIILFAAIAGLVLSIAVFNFINLSTAMSFTRYVEIAIRKTSGASRVEIIFQFLLESITIVFISAILSFLILEVAYPSFLEIVGKEILNPMNTLDRLLNTAGIAVILGILSGTYPALLLSGLAPKKILKGRPDSGPRGQYLRKGMVIFQFAITVFLIFATWITLDQLKYIQKKDLGFRFDQTLTFKISNNEMYENRRIFKERILQMSGVENVTLISGEPGGFHDRFSFKVEEHEGNIGLRTVFTDFDYLTTFDLDLVNGRNFNRDFPTDSTEAVIINEEAAEFLGWNPEEALGKTMQNSFRDEKVRRIIGVVKDYNFRSLKEKMEPLVISIGNDNRVGVIRFATSDIQGLISGLTKEWNKLVNGYPFEFSFLDDQIARLYEDESRQSNLFFIFSALAIFIACIGLFALSTFSASRRMKEMAIRKVHGARKGQVMMILNREYIVLVLAGTILMTPFGWFLMERWLQNFEYHIEISFMYILGTMLIALAMSIITISYQAYKLAVSNPSRILRFE